MDTPDGFGAMHVLAVRGWARVLPPGAESILKAGLIRSRDGGFELTELGHRRHRSLLDAERLTLDLRRLENVSGDVGKLAQRARQLSARWAGAWTELAHVSVIAQFSAFVRDTHPLLEEAGAVAARFDAYAPRLASADRWLRSGRRAFAVDRSVDSVTAVWAEFHEDYLQTLGWGQTLDFSQAVCSPYWIRPT